MTAHQLLLMPCPYAGIETNDIYVLVDVIFSVGQFFKNLVAIFNQFS